MKSSRLAALLGAAVLATTLASAAPPVENIDKAHHPHLAAAQGLSRQAFDQIAEARQANDFDMDGHAAKAMNLLIEVNNELKAAAEAANKNAGKKK